jgi:hypothetical protein
VRSVSALIVVAAIAAPLGGCVTTQQRSARAKVRAEQVLAARAHHHARHHHATHHRR